MSGETLRAPRGTGLDGGATGKSGLRRGCSRLSSLTPIMSSGVVDGAIDKSELLTQETPASAFHLAPKATVRHGTQASAKLRGELYGIRRRWEVLVMVFANNSGDRAGCSHWEEGFRNHFL